MKAAELAAYATAELAARADAERAANMRAYMKTTMPFFGVAAPERKAIAREVKQRFPPRSTREYEAGIRSLWRLRHREEKYLAMAYAGSWPQFIGMRSLPLYERMIREGAWWDFVDEIAVRLVGRLRREEPDRMAAIMERWLEDEDMWIRRSAILSQLGRREDTDEAQLFDFCLRRAEEREFFIRKAIGWALRDYSYARPDAVRRFLLEHREQLSGLSYREGARALVRRGLMS